jgi:hypothetical protein
MLEHSSQVERKLVVLNSIEYPIVRLGPLVIWLA